MKVSVGNDTYKLTKYDKVQITDVTLMKKPNIGRDLLQFWKMNCADINNNSKKESFVKSTKTFSPTSHSEATSLSPIQKSFMYIETSSGNHGKDVFVSFERTDFIQISKITFSYNRFQF